MQDDQFFVGDALDDPFTEDLSMVTQTIDQQVSGPYISLNHRLGWPFDEPELIDIAWPVKPDIQNLVFTALWESVWASH